MMIVTAIVTHENVWSVIVEIVGQWLSLINAC